MSYRITSTRFERDIATDRNWLVRLLLAIGGSLLALGFLPSCGDEAPGLTSELNSVAEHEDQLLLEGQHNLWNGNVFGASAVVPVCFIDGARDTIHGTISCPNMNAGTDCLGEPFTLAAPPPPAVNPYRYTGASATVRANLISYIRTTIEESWGRYANINFTGWTTCPRTANGRHRDADLVGYVAIELSKVPYSTSHGLCDADSDCDTASACTAQGTQGTCAWECTSNSACGYAARCTGGVCMPDAVDQSDIGKVASAPTAMRLNWLAINSATDPNNTLNLLHEFGHALGFSHEWLRSSVPGNTLGTEDDGRSIMHYGPNTLSAWDILGIQKAYGRKPTGSVVGRSGQCAGVYNASTAAGTAIVGTFCSGSPATTFLRESGTYHMRNGLANRCLNIQTAVGPNALISWDCTSTNNEDFVFQDVEWRAMGNMCVHRNGSLLELRECTGGAEQKWRFFTTTGGGATTPYWQIIANNGDCVEAQTTSGAIGEQLRVRTCSSTNTKQRFRFPGLGRVTYESNQGLCLNVSGGRAVNSNIVLWNDCSSSPGYNSQFYLSGQLKAPSANYCMWSGGRSTQLSMSTCSSSPSQRWDYYF